MYQKFQLKCISADISEIIITATTTKIGKKFPHKKENEMYLKYFDFSIINKITIKNL